MHVAAAACSLFRSIRSPSSSVRLFAYVICFYALFRVRFPPQVSGQATSRPRESFSIQVCQFRVSSTRSSTLCLCHSPPGSRTTCSPPASVPVYGTGTEHTLTTAVCGFKFCPLGHASLRSRITKVFRNSISVYTRCSDHSRSRAYIRLFCPSILPTETFEGSERYGHLDARSRVRHPSPTIGTQRRYVRTSKAEIPCVRHARRFTSCINNNLCMYSVVNYTVCRYTDPLLCSYRL